MQKTSLELREDVAFKIRTAENIATKAQDAKLPLTEEEITETDTLLAEAKALQADIEKLERAEKQLDRIHGAAKDFHTASDGPQTTTNEIADTSVGVTPDTIPAQYNKTWGKLRAFTGGDSIAKDRYDAFEAGMWLRAKFFDDHKADRWCELNGVYHSLAQEEGSASAGGNLVPAPLLARIIEQRDLFGLFRQEAELIPMGRDTLSIPKLTTGTTATFFAESQTISESDAAFTQVNLTAKKMGIVTRISNELAEDAVINLADWLARDLGVAFASKEDEVGFAGDGTASDAGILGIATIFTDATVTGTSVLAGGVQATSGDDQFSELIIGDFHRLMATLPAYARPNAKWYISSFGLDQALHRLAGALSGNSMVTIQGDLNLMFLGSPVVLTEKLLNSDAVTNDATMLLYGDLRAASIVGDRRGFNLATSADRYFLEDQIALRATSRIDIANHGTGTAATAGPIVALLGQT